MNELLQLDLTNLSYGALFVWLLFDTNKKNKEREDNTHKNNKEREEKYQETINSLASALGDVKDIKEDIKDINNYIRGGKNG